MAETGHISIHAENILPIIKRWLYSEKEIYIRELISNAADAILKLQKLSLIGETSSEIPEARITVTVDKEKKCLVISDTGLGMTADEIKRYINQVAFSGVQDFLEKYKDKDDSQQVIGHFGLGFYSAFMVANTVEINTLSYKKGAEAAHWRCEGSTDFTVSKGDRKTIGTDIILHLADDSQEMLDADHVKSLLKRYCAFIRFPIYMQDELVNEPKPLWTKSPTELNDQDYKDFYHKLFPTAAEPLFWIHLNVDYPFNLKGVLYFPRLQHELDASQGQVKLFCNQVYVADNSKELIPEFLTLLKGVIDCPDLPLNVSRSYLQSDPTVRKISEHITKKIADKLSGMAKTDREHYLKYWDDIHPFVKFGMMRDDKFYERMSEHLLFKTSSQEYLTLAEYKEKMKDKLDDGQVIYCSDKVAQANYVRMLEEHDIAVVIADTLIDQHFLPYLEMRSSREYKFQRVDADISSHLLDKPSASIIDPTDQKTGDVKLNDLFRKFLPSDKIKLRIETFKSSKVPAMLLVDENRRRFKEMSKSAPFAAFQQALGEDEETLVINQSNHAVRNLLNLAKTFNKDEEAKLIVEQIYDLAQLQQGNFTPERMQRFIDRSTDILGKLA